MSPATLPFKFRASSRPQFHHAFEERQGDKGRLVLGSAIHLQHLQKSLSQTVDTTAVLVFCGDRMAWAIIAGILVSMLEFQCKVQQTILSQRAMASWLPLVFTKVRRRSGIITERTGWVIIALQPEAAEAPCPGPPACLPCPPLHWGKKLERGQD